MAGLYSPAKKSNASEKDSFTDPASPIGKARFTEGNEEENLVLKKI